MKDFFLSLFPANDFSLIAVVLGLPLLGAFVNGVFGPRLGKAAVRLMTLVVTGASFVAAIATFITLDAVISAAKTTHVAGAHGAAARELHAHSKLMWTAWEWMRTSHTASGVEMPVTIDLKFSVDALSGVMMLVVTGVGFLIHIYSTSYMAKDKAYWRFFAYLNLFVFSMLVLILADNLPVLFIGWEGVGLCSYLLIGFWYDKTPNAQAGKKAFIANRIGDFGLLCAMFLLVYYTGALDWSGIESGAHNLVSGGDAQQVHLWPIGNGRFQDTTLLGLRIPLSLLQPTTALTLTGATAVSAALFLGCTGKSAQLPLYVWLPDAMAGPTPVSALIHAATMVTAGLYLICRLSFVFVLSPPVMMLIAFTGALTALLAAAIALTQNDIKKVLAYSTVSQLGFMFLAVGVGAFTAGFFHVFTHAFFKACLFLGAGSVIHAMHDRVHDDDRAQDMRNMGGLRRFMPLTFGTFAASTLAIIGFPLTSGFFSKDEILAQTLINQPGDPSAKGADVWLPPGWMNWCLWTMGIVAATLTAFYMCRAVFMVFFGDFRGWTIGRSSVVHASPHDDDHHAEDDLSMPGAPPHESARAITIPLLILATCAIFAGVLNPGALKLLGIHFLPMEHWLEPVFERAAKGVHVAEHEVAHGRELLSTLGAFCAFSVGTYVAYWMYIVKKGTLEASYMRRATAFAASFGGAMLVLLGAVALAVSGKDAFVIKFSTIVMWALVAGGLGLSFHTVKKRVVGLDYVYDNSVGVAVDALADTATSSDQGFVDLILARLSALLVAALGTMLRIVQNGVVHVYAAMMVVGMAGLGWFFVQPHANTSVAEKGNGDYVVAAAPGVGYSYRWSPDAKEDAHPKAFSATDSIKIHLDEGASKTLKIEVRNSFSSALDLPLVRNLLPPIATKEVTVTRPKVAKLNVMPAMGER